MGKKRENSPIYFLKLSPKPHERDTAGIGSKLFWPETFNIPAKTKAVGLERRVRHGSWVVHHWHRGDPCPQIFLQLCSVAVIAVGLQRL